MMNKHVHSRPGLRTTAALCLLVATACGTDLGDLVPDDSGTSSGTPGTSDGSTAPDGGSTMPGDASGTSTGPDSGDETDSGDSGETGGTAAISVFPPDSSPFGQSYADWAVAWWQWAISIPAETNPIVGGDCGQGQGGEVWFLAGNMGGVETRQCTLPSDVGVLFPIANGLCVPCPEVWGPDECALLQADALAGCFDGFFDEAALVVELDGEPLENPTSYLVPTTLTELTYEGADPSLFFTPADAVEPGVPAADAECAAPLSEPNACDAPAGPRPASAGGFWVMLDHLPPGEHTVRFGGALGPAESPLLELDVTYELTVE